VALANGNVRFCGNNTGNEGTATNGRTYGETICITDGTLASAATASSVAEVQFLILGNPQFAMMDNIAFQPGTGNWLIHEDSDQLVGNNDLWDCADDGADADFLSDGCIRVATINDGAGNPQNSEGAEWTGGIFSADGKHFYVSVQHNVSGKGVILDITGWK
jgi:secreted PhoX family phosphatase